MKNLVTFSELESKIMSLKIGRYNTNIIQPEALINDIHLEKYDLVRIRTHADDIDAISNLEKINCPYYFGGAVRRYKVNCFETPLPAFSQTDISFELYRGQNKNTLQELFHSSMFYNPIGYTKTPVLQKYITKEMEIQCLFEYHAYINNNDLFPDNYLWFMKINHEAVGFIAINAFRNESKVDSSLAGFPPKYQGRGLFANLLRQVRKFCREEQITYFCCGARLDNYYSQTALEKEHMINDGAHYIFHATPLLSKLS